MKITIYPFTTPKGGIHVMNAFIEFIKQKHDVIIEQSPNFHRCNLAVIWSVLWNNKQRKSIWNYYRSRGIDVLVMEVGSLKRNTLWKFGLNGINRDAEFGNYNCPDDRWKLLNLPNNEWKTNGDYIIICCQNTNSYAWKGAKSSEQWVMDTIKKLRQYTSRDILVRSHPRHPLRLTHTDLDPYKAYIDKPTFVGGYDDFNLTKKLDTCWALINRNSNPAIEAVIKGVPVFVDPDSLAFSVGNLDLSDIENPRRPDRTQWFNDISYTEWSVDEIKQGIPWQRILPFFR